MHTLQGRFRQDSMSCSRCCKETSTKSVQLDLSKYGFGGDIARLNCTLCENFIAMKFADDIINVDEVLEDEKKTCWQEARTVKERIVYYALCQIIYPERDEPNADKFESLYDFADDSDLVMLRWQNGVPVGFYTLKRKGSLISSTNEEYAMPTLDTAYVRSGHRNQGIGTEILNNITEIFPDEDIGFSRPISAGMWKVLEKYLTECKSRRLRFWEVDGAGNEGNRKLIWFMLKKRKSV